MGNRLPDASLLKRVVAAAESGARVVVICNLVADAQRVHHELQALTQLHVELFHSRFRFCDRQKREAEIIKHYGKGSCSGGRILVATQVIEQSLDLDFDWMITQLCPIDLLFQRLGRLFRHPERLRPADFPSPSCVVLIPPRQTSQLAYGLHGAIYEDQRVLWRTEGWLSQKERICFPAAYTAAIEAVYDPEPWPQEPAEVTKSHEEYLCKIDEPRRYGAHQLTTTDANPWRDTDVNASRLTRDGETSLNVVLIQAGTKRQFLDGQAWDCLEEWELDEALNLNTVPVPFTWRGELPAADEKLNGMILLEMTPSDDGWKGNHKQTNYVYHPKTGLEKSKHESTD